MCTMVKNGDEIKDFRGDPWIFVCISRHPEIDKQGKVTVRNIDPLSRIETMEFYPSVFNCVIHENSVWKDCKHV